MELHHPRSRFISRNERDKVEVHFRNQYRLDIILWTGNPAQKPTIEKTPSDCTSPSLCCNKVLVPNERCQRRPTRKGSCSSHCTSSYRHGRFWLWKNQGKEMDEEHILYQPRVPRSRGEVHGPSIPSANFYVTMLSFSGKFCIQLVCRQLSLLSQHSDCDSVNHISDEYYGWRSPSALLFILVRWVSSLEISRQRYKFGATRGEAYHIIFQVTSARSLLIKALLFQPQFLALLCQVTRVAP